MKKDLFFICLIMSMIVSTGCSVVNDGEIGIRLNKFTGAIDREYVGRGPELVILDSLIILDATEIRIDVNDIRPKDKDNVLLQDMDLTVTYRVNKEKAVEFYLQTKEIDRLPDGTVALGGKVISKELNGAVQESFKQFKSYEAQSRRKDLEQAIATTLQAKLNERFPEVFKIEDINTYQISLDPSIEKTIQSQAIVKSEQDLMAAREELARRQAGLLEIEIEGFKKIANKTGISVEKLIDLRMTQEYHKVLNELARSNSNVQVQVPTGNKGK